MSKDHYKKAPGKPSTRMFRDKLAIESILKRMNWIGTAMLFPYTWDGHRRLARIKLRKVLGAIEWDMVYDSPVYFKGKEDDLLGLFPMDIDNGTTVITIPTPKGWRCKRKRCKIDYFHSHEAYPSLNKSIDK